MKCNRRTLARLPSYNVYMFSIKTAVCYLLDTSLISPWESNQRVSLGRVKNRHFHISLGKFMSFWTWAFSSCSNNSHLSTIPNFVFCLYVFFRPRHSGPAVQIEPICCVSLPASVEKWSNNSLAQGCVMLAHSALEARQLTESAIWIWVDMDLLKYIIQIKYTSHNKKWT